MSMMRTSNPALNDAVFQIHDSTSSTTMTLQGTVAKTAILLAILMVGAGFTWYQAMQSFDGAAVDAARGAGRVAIPASIMTYGVVGAIAGLILAMITIFKPAVSPYTSPLY